MGCKKEVTYLQELGGRFLELAGADIVSDRQPMHV
jgi:hypothetical protein